MPNSSDQVHPLVASLQKHWIEKYVGAQSFWIHDENPLRPHALLTSGMHSNGFFNSKPIIAQDDLMHGAATDLIRLSNAVHCLDPWDVDGVVGPQTGATKMAKFLSEEIMAVTAKECFSASPAKHEEDGVKTMVFNPEEKEPLIGKTILLCEDVCTTGGSIARTADAIVAAGGYVLPYVLVLVNRSGETEIDGRKIIALISKHMPTWQADECPLCKAGSKAIRPKEGDNWALLTAEY